MIKTKTSVLDRTCNKINLIIKKGVHKYNNNNNNNNIRENIHSRIRVHLEITQAVVIM